MAIGFIVYTLTWTSQNQTGVNKLQIPIYEIINYFDFSSIVSSI